MYANKKVILFKFRITFFNIFFVKNEFHKFFWVYLW